jgi:hypothetical protein
MQHERQESSSEDGVAHPDVVAGPGPLHPRKLAELHATVKSVVRLRRVHGLEVRGDMMAERRSDSCAAVERRCK